MDKFPGPVHADNEDEAEARRQDLKNRFRSVTRRIDRGSGPGLRLSASGAGYSPFEIGIGVIGVLFVLWAVARGMGLV